MLMGNKKKLILWKAKKYKHNVKQTTVLKTLFFVDFGESKGLYKNKGVYINKKILIIFWLKLKNIGK